MIHMFVTIRDDYLALSLPQPGFTLNKRCILSSLPSFYLQQFEPSLGRYSTYKEDRNSLCVSLCDKSCLLSLWLCLQDLVRIVYPQYLSSYYGASPIPVCISLAAPARRTRHGNSEIPHCDCWQSPPIDCISAYRWPGLSLPSSSSVGAWQKLNILAFGSNYPRRSTVNLAIFWQG